ncbi:MAG: type II secretion system protein [Candidatus Levybacteria bacterium]|nr:type II secretion system protein [Candidatus Levybacteria bacterium]
MKKIRSSAGFTLIELLVVIGILGILASSLIATIDPFEQLKKGQDANVKNTAAEFVNANIRFYTTHNELPWVNNSTCSSEAGGTTPSAKNLAGMTTGCLGALVGDGELKPGFTTVTNTLKEILVSGNANDVIACFKPQSKAQQRDANTIYNSSGTATTGCASTSGSSGTYCYWCAK